MEHIFLLPGKYRIAKQPEIIDTLVGSCVAVCIFNKQNGRAAMNHFLRARPNEKTVGNIGEFGSTSTEHIIKALMESDPNPTHYVAQVFGGASVIKSKSNSYNIGLNNIEIALETLAAYRIRVTKKEVGGERGRRVKFETATNTIHCRFAGQVEKKYRNQTADSDKT